ncbi:CoA-binding protein [Rhodoferax ferrireducens]|nr:CoA-binding protein [Rhodoferax ferrireducens]
MSQTETIRQILATCRTVAVVGLSPKPERASFEVAHYMQAHGWRIIPVNPVAAASGLTILGEPVYASLQEAAQHASIDLVDVFRNSADVPPVAQEAIAIGARALWLQLGIENAQAGAAAQAAGLWVVQNQCLKVEHAASA